MSMLDFWSVSHFLPPWVGCSYHFRLSNVGGLDLSPFAETLTNPIVAESSIRDLEPFQ